MSEKAECILALYWVCRKCNTDNFIRCIHNDDGTGMFYKKHFKCSKCKVTFKKEPELNQAFLWICPECGIDNFVKAILLELTIEEQEELSEQHSRDPGDFEKLITCPDRVKCSTCNNEFGTQNENKQ